MNINTAYEQMGKAAPVRASDTAAAEFEAVYCEQFEATEATAQEAVTEAAVLIRAAQKLAQAMAFSGQDIVQAQACDIPAIRAPRQQSLRVYHASQVALEAFLDSLLEGCEPEQRKAIETLVSAAFTEAL